MGKPTRLLLAAAFGALVLALASHAAYANRSIGLTVAEGELGSVRAESRAITFAGEEGVTTVTCEIATTLSLHRSIAKTRGESAGLVTRVETRNCGVSAVRILGLPWGMTYQSFTGTLPNITSARVQTTGFALLLEILAGLVRCLYSGNPQQTTVGGTTATELRFDETVTLPLRTQLGGTCPRNLSIRGALTLRPSLRLALLGPPMVVSLGDSFISGEGGRWAGNTALREAEASIDALGETAYFDEPEGIEETIEGCHRSRSAEVQIGGGVTSVNLACSGATVETRTGGQFKPGLDRYDSEGQQSQVVMLEQIARAHPEIKLVVVSIGGNNFSIGEIVFECVTRYLENGAKCESVRRITDHFILREAEAVKRRIKEGLLNIDTVMTAAGYEARRPFTLLAQNYASPAPEERTAMRHREDERVAEAAERGERSERVLETVTAGKMRQWWDGCGFYDRDLAWAKATAVTTMNRAISDAANEAEAMTRLTILRLDLATAFDERRLCENTVRLMNETTLRRWDETGASDEVEWFTRIWRTGEESHSIIESGHPNYWGQLAMRNCLRRAYASGRPVGGTCTRNGTGLEGGEPRMQLR